MVTAGNFLLAGPFADALCLTLDSIARSVRKISLDSRLPFFITSFPE